MDISKQVTGLQHIGIPTNDIEATIAFYEWLGFETAFRTVNGTEAVAFLQLKNVMIETYQNGQAALKPGAVDHVCLDVTDIEAVFDQITKDGSYEVLDTAIQSLPFWENGVRFFTILGPNKEKIEFCQKL